MHRSPSSNPLLALLLMVFAVISFTLMRHHRAELTRARSELEALIDPAEVIYRLGGDRFEIVELQGRFAVLERGGDAILQYSGSSRILHPTGETSRVPVQIWWNERTGAIELSARAFGQTTAPSWTSVMPESQLGHAFALRLREHGWLSFVASTGVAVFGIGALVALVFHHLQGAVAREVKRSRTHFKKRTRRALKLELE